MEVNQFTPVTAERGTLTARIQDFLGTIANRKPETRRTYELALREFMRWYDRESSFCFSGDDVLRYREHLRFAKNMRVSSVATYLNGFRQFCEYLFQQGIIQYNPVRDVVSCKRPAVHDQEVLSGEEVKRLLAAVDTSEKRGLRDLLILRLMVEYGLGEVELVRADVADYISSSETGALRVQGKGRDEKNEVVILREDMVMLLNRYLAVRSGRNKSQPLFMSDGNRTRGMRMTTRGIRDRVNYYFWLVGIKGTHGPNITPHSLRYAAAATMAEAGASAYEIKKRMRFGSLAKAQRYIDRL